MGYEYKITKSKQEKTLQKAYIIFTATFLILCSAAIVVYQGQGELFEYIQSANKYTNLPVHIEEVISILKDSEIGIQAFSSTKDSAFLVPLNRVSTQVDSVLNILHSYVQLGVLSEREIYDIISLSNRIVSLQKSYLNDLSYPQKVNFEYRKLKMDSLRNVIARIRKTDTQNSTQLRKNQDKSIQKQRFYLILIIFTALSIFLVAAFFILKFIKNLIITQKELAQKVSEVEKYNDELDQYSFTITHYLQEPLRKIRLLLSRFDAKNKVYFTEGGQTEFKKIDDTAFLAQTYLNEFLNYLKLMHDDNKNFEWINLNDIIDSVLSELNPKIIASNATITIDKMPNIKANTYFMKLLYWHLIDNALIYTYPDRQPIIQIGFEEGSQEEIHLYVQDNGFGIDMEHSEKVFELFHRLKIHPHESGIGMGLAICKRILDVHNGRIKVVSEEGKGSVFHIYLPKMLS